MDAAFPDQVHFARFMRLITETKIVAARVFPKHSDMFPGGLVSMYNVPLDLQPLSRNVKADYLESNLEFLKELDSQLPPTQRFRRRHSHHHRRDTIAGSSSCSFGDRIGIRSCKSSFKIERSTDA